MVSRADCKKVMFEWLKAMRVTESRKKCHLFWLNTDLMPWDCVAALAQAKSDTKEGAWLLVARQHPWALLCH